MNAAEFEQLYQSLRYRRFDIPGVEGGWIELTASTDNRPFEVGIVQAARVSTTGADERNTTPEQDERLFRRLWLDRHMSPFEHVTLQVRASVPLFVQAQWVRHRWAAHSIESLRYRAKGEPDFYFPEEWRAQSKVNMQGEDGLLGEYQSYELLSALAEFCRQGAEYYEEAIQKGAERGMARMFLPVNVFSTMLVSAHFRSWTEFLSLRNAPEAQYEIRAYAKVLEEQILWPLFPTWAKIRQENQS